MYTQSTDCNLWRTDKHYTTRKLTEHQKGSAGVIVPAENLVGHFRPSLRACHLPWNRVNGWTWSITIKFHKESCMTRRGTRRDFLHQTCTQSRSFIFVVTVVLLLFFFTMFSIGWKHSTCLQLERSSLTLVAIMWAAFFCFKNCTQRQLRVFFLSLSGGSAPSTQAPVGVHYSTTLTDEGLPLHFFAFRFSKKKRTWESSIHPYSHTAVIPLINTSDHWANTWQHNSSVTVHINSTIDMPDQIHISIITSCLAVGAVLIILLRFHCLQKRLQRGSESDQSQPQQNSEGRLKWKDTFSLRWRRARKSLEQLF